MAGLITEGSSVHAEMRDRPEGEGPDESVDGVPDKELAWEYKDKFPKRRSMFLKNFVARLKTWWSKFIMPQT